MPDKDALEHFVESAERELTTSARSLDLGSIRCAADLIEAAEANGGRVHVTGIGKPAHVAQYAASLLASTGTAAVFLHGTEATHGSAGQLREGDVVVAISNSGSTAELLATTNAARAMGTKLIAVTGAETSALGTSADCVLVARVDDEGGPLGLAPRNSILAETLVLCALSVELQARKQLTREEYNQRHPGGALGKKSS